MPKLDLQLSRILFVGLLLAAYTVLKIKHVDIPSWLDIALASVLVGTAHGLSPFKGQPDVVDKLSKRPPAMPDEEDTKP